MGTQSTVRYTMTAFTNSSEAEMYVYESTDATTFTLVRGPAYRPPTGLIRDPSVIRHADGAYYITYTTGWDGDTIGFARSTDRIEWTFLYNYTVPIPGIRHTWAPEWFIDPGGSVNVIVSLHGGEYFQPHLMTATDEALQSWSPLTPLEGITAAPGSLGYIDTTVSVLDGRYYAFTKNETTKEVELAVAESLLGPYEFIETGDWAGWGAPREGQCVIALPDGGHRIYLDAYTEGRYLYSDSSDGFRTWTPPRELPDISGFVRHFTVLPEYESA
ncbi:glycoside hydrolase [Nocardia transvalensis]|uniref:glycoside hydrolase n=1 Tax=Nocardia transvalensis TaxID=37333 RepID=UPI001E3ACFDA|nr:glycoside hydrolase [Nocardia transvalensis]